MKEGNRVRLTDPFEKISENTICNLGFFFFIFVVN